MIMEIMVIAGKPCALVQWEKPKPTMEKTDPYRMILR